MPPDLLSLLWLLTVHVCLYPPHLGHALWSLNWSGLVVRHSVPKGSGSHKQPCGLTSRNPSCGFVAFSSLFYNNNQNWLNFKPCNNAKVPLEWCSYFMEWSLAIAVTKPWIGIMFQQECDNWLVSTVASPVKWCGFSRSCLSIWICAFVK